MTTTQFARFQSLRKKLFARIEEEIDSIDPTARKSEGHIEVGFSNYTEDPEVAGEHGYISVFCDLLGGSRHHMFQGTFDECLNQLENYITIDDE